MDALNINDVSRIYLGIQGENECRAITIDVRPWLVAHPQGSVSIWHKRNGDATPSPTGATFDYDAGTVTWVPTSTDTYVSGEGLAEIRLTEGTVIKKSRGVITGVSPALTGAGVPLGSDWASYIDEVDRIKALAVAAAEDSEDSAEDAEAWAVGQRDGTDVESDDPTYHNNSKYYMQQTQAEVQNAEAWATGKRSGADVGSSDPTYHNNAKYYAGAAKDEADAAEAAKDEILGMDVQALPLPEGSDPTVNYSGGTMTFGIPKGDHGQITAETEQYQISASGTTVPTGSWLDERPNLVQGEFLWIKRVRTWNNSGETTTSYEAYYTAVDGSSATVEFDDSPVSGSQKAVRSGGLYTAFSGKADKVASATNGHFAALDSNGNLTDSGKDASSFPSLVSNPTSGNFAGLDSSGNITDSGKSASDFAEKNNPEFTGYMSNGRKSNTTKGTKSIAYGTDATASAEGAIATGKNTTASGSFSHAEGEDVIASGRYEKSFGVLNYGNKSIPAWQSNTSYTVGDLVRRTVTGSSTSYYIYRCIENHTSDSTFDSRKWETVQISKSSISHKFIETVGVGWTYTLFKKNGRALDFEGNEYLKGDLFVQCDDDSSGGSKVATKESVDALTKNNYDTAVDLTAYSASSLFTAASDGYITLRTAAQGEIATVNLYDAVESTNMLSRVKQQDNTAQGMSIYVKKGMKMYGAATGSATSKFIPLK